MSILTPLKYSIYATTIASLTLVILVFFPYAPPQHLIERITPSMQSNYSVLGSAEYAILIDYDKAVFQKRLWVVDIETEEVLIRSHVSHAGKSGWLWPSIFSNEIGSKLSSTGLFVTAQSYESTHGEGGYKIGMRIKGLELNVNDNVYQRNIVFHSSSGYWSSGCFMTDPVTNKEIIDLTKDGNLVLVQYTK